MVLSAFFGFYLMIKALWVSSKGVSSSKIGDELALLQPASGQYFTLNQTGAIVWQLLEEPHSTDEIALAVAEKYDISASECQDDIGEIIVRLGDAGLVQKA